METYTPLELKVLSFMDSEKSYFVMPNDIPFLTDRSFYKVMSNLEKKNMVIRNNETNQGIPTFLGYSLTQKFFKTLSK